MLISDTICALSTPAGSGAIGVIRLSGPDAVAVTDALVRFPDGENKLASQPANTLHFCRFFRDETLLDEVVVSLFRSPRSYTGEDVVEISCHGSVYIQQKILEALILKGARLAKPGEFTQRAFLNGKMDLAQAEGVADLIASSSEASHRLALDQMRGGFSEEISKLRQELLHFASLIELELDFSEEDVEFADRPQLNALLDRIEPLLNNLIASFEYGNVVKNGVPVAIIGRTNSGKSTLLNRLLRDEKAIVSEIHGTTRDFIEDVIHIRGIAFRFIDTAGLRHTDDRIEHEGIQRTYRKYRQARMVLVMIDATEAPEEVDQSLGFLRQEAIADRIHVFVLNKSDLLSEEALAHIQQHYSSVWGDLGRVIPLSAREGTHVSGLEELLADLAVSQPEESTGVVVTNVRHFEALSHSSQALRRTREGLISGLPTDLIAQDIREILHYLGEITGEISTDEILGNIFKNFCIGK